MSKFHHVLTVNKQDSECRWKLSGRLANPGNPGPDRSEFSRPSRATGWRGLIHRGLIEPRRCGDGSISAMHLVSWYGGRSLAWSVAASARVGLGRWRPASAWRRGKLWVRRCSQRARAAPHPRRARLGSSSWSWRASTARYLGDTPGHLGRAASGRVAPRIALGDPVMRGTTQVGRSPTSTGTRPAKAWKSSSTRRPSVRICIGDPVWIPIPADSGPLTAPAVGSGEHPEPDGGVEGEHAPAVADEEVAVLADDLVVVAAGVQVGDDLGPPRDRSASARRGSGRRRAGSRARSARPRRG